MNTINRSAIVVTPAQPFLDWLRGVDPTSAQLTLDDLTREPTIYLLPEFDSDEEPLQSLRKVARDIFEEQLNAWYRVPSVWPVKRGLTTFQQWFDYSFHSMIVDLCKDPLRRDEM